MKKSRSSLPSFFIPHPSSLLVVIAIIAFLVGMA
jgi:hypothetical protein